MPSIDHCTLCDKYLKLFGIGDKLDNMIATVAQHLGDIELAVQHAKAGLVRHNNPVNILIVYLKLGVHVMRAVELELEEEQEAGKD